MGEQLVHVSDDLVEIDFISFGWIATRQGQKVPHETSATFRGLDDLFGAFDYALTCRRRAKQDCLGYASFTVFGGKMPEGLPVSRWSRAVILDTRPGRVREDDRGDDPVSRIDVKPSCVRAYEKGGEQ